MSATDGGYWIAEPTFVPDLARLDSIANENGHYLALAIEEPVKHAYARITTPERPIGDWAYAILGPLLLSGRAEELLRKFKVCSSARLIPLTVLQDSGEWVADLTLFYGPQRWDILDTDRSTYRVVPGTNLVGTVSEWVLDSKRLPHYDAFYNDQFSWVFSGALHDAILSEGLTGFEFTEAEVL